MFVNAAAVGVVGLTVPRDTVKQSSSTLCRASGCNSNFTVQYGVKPLVVRSGYTPSVYQTTYDTECGYSEKS